MTKQKSGRDLLFRPQCIVVKFLLSLNDQWHRAGMKNPAKAESIYAHSLKAVFISPNNLFL